jgi:CheY-like chemotaxis protein
MNQPSIEGEPSARRDVLVVEEYGPLRDLLSRALEQGSFKVWLARSGREALEIFQFHADLITVVLLDVGMSGLDGPQTLAALRAVRPDLTCCFMTGGGGRYADAELLGMGAARVFTKPFSLDDLVRFLKQLEGAGEQRASPRRGEKQFKIFVVEAGTSVPAREGWLRDHSSGGVGVFLPEPARLGSVLCVHAASSPDEAAWVQVIVRHCRPQGDSWFIGGQFLGDAASTTLLIGA